MLSGAPMMGSLGKVDLIRVFDMYLLATFVFATARSIRMYLDVLRFVIRFPDRWPHLLRLVRAHRGVLATRSVVLPAASALVLLLAQWVASAFVWPDAVVTVDHLRERPLALVILGTLGAVILAVDFLGLLQVRRFDRESIERQLDRAEYWLSSKASHVLRVVTFGIVDPRRKVTTELRAALANVGQSLSTRLWLVSLDAGLNVAFGLAIWMTWHIA